MADNELHYRFAWSLSSTPEELWPLVADTNRFNLETGTPEVETSAGTAPPGYKSLELRVAGRSIPYREAPFQWVRPRRFGVGRTYGRGPFRALRVLVELTPSASGGTDLGYRVWVTPRGQAGRLLAPVVIDRIARRRFEAAFRRYDAAALAQRGNAAPEVVRPPSPTPPKLAPGGRERLARLSTDLAGQGLDRGLVDRLAATIQTADDIEARRLRPYPLADTWQAERRRTLELFLHSTRAGLTESRWELLCPLCRGAASSSETLAGVRSDVHCSSCGIDFTAGFERSVELVFSPSPAIREVEQADYCVGGPQLTPHIVVQQLLEPGERRRVEVALAPGAYRVRAAGVDSMPRLSVEEQGAAEAEVRLGADGSLEVDDRPLRGDVDLTLENGTDEARLVLLERTAWADDAATAADVTSLQAFRDLFAAEALRPGEELGIGSLTIVFTDLRDSTRLYRQIGDAPAFGSVVGHFDVLREAIAREGGAVVKTLGDAVMAVFRRPVGALQAMLDAQLALAHPDAGARPLALKVGIHTGPCIAVTLNDRLDYFGSTVNAAARLVGLSRGDDAVISEAVRIDPEVVAAVASEGLGLERLDAELKGFDDDRFELWRVTRSG
jgi:class 3 adenylate cyclase